MDRIQNRLDLGGWTVRWNIDMAARNRASGDWTDKTIAQYARERAGAEPDKVMVIENQRSLTARELYAAAQRLAGWFIALGLSRGDVVSFQLPNWWEVSVIDLAACMCGIVVNPIVPMNRDAEVGYMLAQSNTKVLFVPGVFRKFDYAEMVRRLMPTLNASPRVVVMRSPNGEFDAFDDILNAAEPLETPLEVHPDSVKLLMYTSGTTGRPKGVLHSHNTILADCVKMKPVMQLGEDDTVFCPSPLTHVTGYLWIVTMPWYGGMTAVTLDTWDPAQAFELAAKHRCAAMFGATPFLKGLLERIRDLDETLPFLRYYLCGGAAVPPGLIYEAAQRLPNCIPWRNFGATEATTMTGPPLSRADIRLGAETDGRLYRCEIKIVDVVTGRTLPPGEEGELLVREPSMALGYARPEDNADAYDEDGFFRMGDLCKVVDIDHIVCTGRKKDLIIRAGENISAKEIEDVLFRMPQVCDVAVVAMPSSKTGESICAYIVVHDGQKLELADIDRWMRQEGLARQKTPERLALIDELPKTASGKIRKDLLRTMAAQAQAASPVA